MLQILGWIRLDLYRDPGQQKWPGLVWGELAVGLDPGMELLAEDCAAELDGKKVH